MGKPWTRNQKIAAWTITVTAAGILCGLFRNEIRQILYLEKMETAVPTSSATPTYQTSGIKNIEVHNRGTNITAPPARRLSAEKKGLADCLKTNTGTFSVSAAANNGEANQYALDFVGVLSAAGWTNEEPIPVRAVFGEKMRSEIRLNFSGKWDTSTQQALLKVGSPEATAFQCFIDSEILASAIPYEEMKTGRLVILVSEQRH